MKKYLYLIIAVLLLSIISLITYQCKQIKKYKNLYDISLQNEKAYEQTAKNDQTKQKVYHITPEQMKTSTDTFVQVITQIQKEKKIRQGELQQASYQISTAQKTDTIVLKDTIFVQDTHIDTIVADSPWYQTHLTLDYPDSITVTPSFHSERYVLISAQRETIKPRSKWWIIRLFQKKHTVINVDIEERNPYIDIDKQKYIEIVR